MKTLFEHCKPTQSESTAAYSIIWMTFLLGLLTALAPLSIDMYLPALPILTNDLNSSASLAQLSLTTCLLGIALGQLFTGPISDVYGRRYPLLAGLLIYIAASLLCVFAPTIWVLIVMRFIQGLAGSAGIVISNAIVRDLYSGSEMTRFFSLLILVNGVAPILSPVLGGQVLLIASWRGIFAVLLGIGLFMLFVVYCGLRETLPATFRSRGGINNAFRTFYELIGNRTFMGYASVQGFVFAAMFAYIAGSPFVLQNIFGVSPQMFSIFFGINSLGIIIASQIVGRLAGRISETRLLVAGLTIAFTGSVILLVMILTGGELYTILLPLFFVVSSVGIVGPSSFSLAMRDQAKSAGSAAALIGVLTFVFGGVMAPLVGIGGSHTAVPMSIIIVISEIMAVLCYLFLVKGK